MLLGLAVSRVHEHWGWRVAHLEPRFHALVTQNRALC